MANVRMLFYGTEESFTNDTFLFVKSNDLNQISFYIKRVDGSESEISLDKMTAVRLVRELKKQIGNLKTDENE